MPPMKNSMKFLLRANKIQTNWLTWKVFSIKSYVWLFFLPTVFSPFFIYYFYKTITETCLKVFYTFFLKKKQKELLIFFFFMKFASLGNIKIYIFPSFSLCEWKCRYIKLVSRSLNSLYLNLILYCKEIYL